MKLSKLIKFALFNLGLAFHLYFCFSLDHCYADRYIVPTKYDYQEEVLIQGASIIVSNKNNTFSMYQTSEEIKDNRANFYFGFSNSTDRPITLYFSNLKVTDQWGRPIRVIHKNEHIDNKKSERNWRIFASALSAGLQSANAQNAGRIDYQTQSSGSFCSNSNSYGSTGWSRQSVNGYGNSYSQGTIHCEALRQQALRQVQEDASNRDHAIQNNYASWEHGLNNFYFDSTTVFPGTLYSANFQIEVPRHLEKELEYLVFTFEIENETHTFCFYCGERVKKWYEFG